MIADADGRGQRERIGEVVSSALAVLAGAASVAVAILLMLSVVGTHSSRRSMGRRAKRPPSAFHPLRGRGVSGLPALAFLGVLQGLQRYGWHRCGSLSQILFTVSR